MVHLRMNYYETRLVVGIRDLSQKLQGDSTLTLEKAKIAIQQREAIAEQQTELKEGSKTNPIWVEQVNSISNVSSAKVDMYIYGQQLVSEVSKSRYVPFVAQ